MKGVKFNGWGISLCWWANVEYPKVVKDKLIELLFGSSGLRLNIVRYNLGGGSDSKIKQNFRLGANMPCIMNNNGSFNLENDKLQLDILDIAVKEGVNKVELFCNSPPYFMTKSGVTNGSNKSFDCNLRSECKDEFVNFLNESYKLMVNKYPVVSIEPFNEPSNPFWTSKVNQEGCFFDYGTRIDIIKKLKNMNSKILISSGDESSSLFGLLWYIFSPKQTVERVNVHGYNYVEWRGIRFNIFDWNIWRKMLRYWYRGDLWLSEYGLGYENSISDSLRLGRNIFRDLGTLYPSAWVYWQVEHITSSWGLLRVDFENPSEIDIQKQYWVFKHFTNTLREGDMYEVVSKNVLKVESDSCIKYIILNDSKKDIVLDGMIDINFEMLECNISDDLNDYTKLLCMPSVILGGSIISVCYKKDVYYKKEV
jgi:hypothetical protein